MVDFSMPADERATPPPSGWDAPNEPEAQPDAFAMLGEVLFRTIPRELTAQLVKAVQDLLAAIKAILQWFIDRLGVSVLSSEAPPLRDIPLS